MKSRGDQDDFSGRGIIGQQIFYIKGILTRIPGGAFNNNIIWIHTTHGIKIKDWRIVPVRIFEQPGITASKQDLFHYPGMVQVDGMGYPISAFMKK